jgi:hypothetical protein
MMSQGQTTQGDNNVNKSPAYNTVLLIMAQYAIHQFVAHSFYVSLLINNRASDSAVVTGNTSAACHA